MEAQTNDEKRQQFREYILKHKLATGLQIIDKTIQALFIWGLTNYLFPGVFGIRGLLGLASEQSSRQFSVFVSLFVVTQSYFLYNVVKIMQMGRQLGFTVEQQAKIVKILFPHRQPWKQKTQQILTFFIRCLIITDIIWICWKFFNGIQTMDSFNPFHVVIVLKVFDLLILQAPEE